MLGLLDSMSKAASEALSWLLTGGPLRDAYERVRGAHGRRPPRTPSPDPRRHALRPVPAGGAGSPTSFRKPPLVQLGGPRSAERTSGTPHLPVNGCDGLEECPADGTRERRSGTCRALVGLPVRAARPPHRPDTNGGRGRACRGIGGRALVADIDTQAACTCWTGVSLTAGTRQSPRLAHIWTRAAPLRHPQRRGRALCSSPPPPTRGEGQERDVRVRRRLDLVRVVAHPRCLAGPHSQAAAQDRPLHRVGSHVQARRMPEFEYEDLLPLGPDETPYRLLTTDGVSTVEAGGHVPALVEPEVLTASPRRRSDIQHLLRPGTCSGCGTSSTTPRPRRNDRFVASTC